MNTTPSLSDSTRASRRNKKPKRAFSKARFEASKAAVLTKWAQLHAQAFKVPAGIYGAVSL